MRMLHASCIAVALFSLSASHVAKAADNYKTDSLPSSNSSGAKQETQSQSDKAAVQQISIDNFTFSPQKLTIARGTTVVWTNKDDVPHTVRSTTNAFKSGTLDTDEKYSFKFNDAGTFPYFCTVHAHMTGEIIVK